MFDMRRARELLVVACLATVSICLPRTGGAASKTAVVAEGHTIESIEREIDLTNQYAITTEILQIQLAPKAKGPLAVALCDLKAKFDRRAYGEVFLVKERAHHTLDELEVATVAGIPNDVFCVSVRLPPAVSPGDKIKIRTQSTVTKVMTPKPSKIRQSETQRMVYDDNTYVLSPYTVETQTTTVKLPDTDITDFTTLEPTEKLGSTIIYGRYSDVEPFKRSVLAVHFAHQTAFVEATKLVREIEISEWGNIYVEETYHLRHGGAELYGEWSRLYFQQDVLRRGNSACKELRARLPAQAHSLYYRDEIGNVSSSHVRRTPKSTEVTLQPRFPLFGGWKIDFIFGYSLPLEGNLWDQKDGLKRLEMQLGSPIESLVVDELELRIVLPEGASSVKVDEMIPFERLSVKHKKFSYLDTVGRPVAVATKYNVVPEHSRAMIIVKYHISELAKFQKPMLLVTVVFLCFASSIIYSRFEMSISKESGKRDQLPHRQKDALQKIYTILKDRQAGRDDMDDVITDMIHTKKTERCSKAHRNLEAKAAGSAKQLRDLSAELDGLAFNDISALRDLLNKERKLQEKYNSQCALKIQLVQSKKEVEHSSTPGDAAVSDLEAEVGSLTKSLFGHL